MPIDRKTGSRLKKRITNGALTLFLIWSLFPVYWMVVTSLKTNRDIYTRPGLFPSAPVLTHYRTTLFDTSFLIFMRNSFLVAVATTAASIIIGSLAAYAITRLHFTGRRWVARSIIFVYLVPPALLFIPLFTVVNTLGLSDTVYSLMITYLTFTVPFCTWLLIGYFSPGPRWWMGAARQGCCGVFSFPWPYRRWPSWLFSHTPCHGTSSSTPWSLSAATPKRRSPSDWPGSSWGMCSCGAS